MPSERRKHGRRALGRPPKHAGRAIARAVATNAIDFRTSIGHNFKALQNALAADRGGWEHCTAAERILIELAAAEMLILRAIFAWSIRQPSLIERSPEGGAALLGPLAKGYTSHAGALTRSLTALGTRPELEAPASLCGKCGATFSTLQAYLGHACPERPAKPQRARVRRPPAADDVEHQPVNVDASDAPLNAEE